jgi:hypothetical protein
MLRMGGMRRILRILGWANIAAGSFVLAYLVLLRSRQSVDNHVVFWAMTIAIGLLLLFACIVRFPTIIVARDADPEKGELTQAELLKAKNDVRTALLQGMAGALLLFGAFFTWRQLQISQEGQVTERFTKAVEQLGHKDRDVRVGGVHALARVARDSIRDREAVQEVLSSYIRGHSPWRGTPTFGATGRDSSDRDCPQRTDWNALTELSTLEVRAPDVQSAMYVLRESFWGANRRSLFLPEVDLRQGDFSYADLKSANFSGSNLATATFRHSKLDQSHFGDDGGQYCGTHLEWTDFTGASLKKVNFEGAYLDGATLDGADLSGARLTRTSLKGVQANTTTKWPTGFDAKSRGVVFDG